MSNKYKFSSQNHVHQLFKDGEWKNLTGTSGIPGVLNKNGLTWWAAGLAVEKLGWLNKKNGTKFRTKAERIQRAKEMQDAISIMSNDQYLDLLDEAYSAHSKKLTDSASAGTDLHALAEKWIKSQIDGSNVAPDEKIMPLVNWAKVNVKKWLWSETHCFSEEHWLGGISDAGFLDYEGRVGVLDIKSSKEAYDSQFIQCAGYDIQLTENGGYDERGNKIFDLEGKKIDYYAILPFGMTNPVPQVRHNVEEFKDGFKACLSLYRLLNK